jgi:cyclase
MRRYFLSCLVLTLFVALPLKAQQSSPPRGAVRPIDPNKAEIKIQKLSSRVYMLQMIPINGATGNFGGNITAFIGDDGIVLIDEGFFNMQSKFEAALRTISDKPVKYVFNTHWHADHTEGDGLFAKTAVIIAQDNARTRMQTGSKRFPPSPVDTLPSLTFDHEITLHIDGEEIHGIHFLSGHTDGDTVYFYPQEKVVQLGDDFVNFNPPSFPAIDMDGDGSGGPEGPMAAEEYVLAHVGDDAKIIPGHGNLVTRSDLAQSLAFLKGATAAVQSDIDAGKTLDQIKQEKVLAKLDYLNLDQAKEDAFVERLYNSLVQKKADVRGAVRP